VSEVIDSYKTLSEASEGIYKEKGSKFIAFAIPVKTEEEIKVELDLIRKKYHDARHHCYAWTLGADRSRFRANDDGEPNHSAGDPILSQIKSLELTNVLVVVVRYFGGTKLGIGGLINAYKVAARDGLTRAQIIDRIITNSVELKYPFSSTNQAMKLIKECEIKITNQIFDNHCTIEGKIPLQHLALFQSEIELLNKLGVEISIKVDFI